MVQATQATRKGTTTRDEILAEVKDLMAGVVGCVLDLRGFERALLARLPKLGKVGKVGRLLVRLFVEMREQALQKTLSGPRCLVARRIATTFGKIPLLRTYVRGEGGMRWIRERAEALLQLRCIHLNGDWNAFLDWALPQLTKPTDEHPVPRIQRHAPASLPQLAEAA